MNDNPRVKAVMSGEEGDLWQACWSLVESAGRDAHENAAFWRLVHEAVCTLFPGEETLCGCNDEQDHRRNAGFCR